MKFTLSKLELKSHSKNQKYVQLVSNFRNYKK